MKSGLAGHHGMQSREEEMLRNMATTLPMMARRGKYNVEELRVVQVRTEDCLVIESFSI